MPLASEHKSKTPGNVLNCATYRANDLINLGLNNVISRWGSGLIRLSFRKVWELRTYSLTSTHLKNGAVIAGYAKLWWGLRGWRASPRTRTRTGAPRMKESSISHVDVPLIILDICLIFRFPRLLMLISAAHLNFFAFCAHWEMWLWTCFKPDLFLLLYCC